MYGKETKLSSIGLDWRSASSFVKWFKKYESIFFWDCFWISCVIWVVNWVTRSSSFVSIKCRLAGKYLRKQRRLAHPLTCNRIIHCQSIPQSLCISQALSFRSTVAKASVREVDVKDSKCSLYRVYSSIEFQILEGFSLSFLITRLIAKSAGLISSFTTGCADADILRFEVNFLKQSSWYCAFTACKLTNIYVSLMTPLQQGNLFSHCKCR